MNRFILTIVCLAVAAGAAPRTTDKERELQVKETERTRLQESVEKMRDSLEQLIAKQYSQKQQAVEQRETDKEELDRQADEQARLMNELARIKEERLSREQALADERATLARKQEEWTYLRSQITDLLLKEADAVTEAFPLDKELRRAGLERVRGKLDGNGSCAATVAAYADYRLQWFRAGDSTGMCRAVVVPEDGAPQELAIARFGNILGYGIDSTDSICYYLRQTGRLGAGKYSTEKISDAALAARLRETLVRWKQAWRIDGPVPVEMMQNDQARFLIAGKRQTAWQSLYASLAKGGWVMIPMLLLPFWVLYLTLAKIVQLAAGGARMRRQLRTVSGHIARSNLEAALTYAKSCRTGITARMAAECIDRRPLGRAAAERSVYELLRIEIPALNRGLNTLAVIAGAAPLLGLLGTISGMITLFAAVTQFGTGDPKFLAGGISEALITAKTGLAIAIPVLFIHDLLRGAKDRLVADLEKTAITLLNTVYPEE
jgi:biopolymer transport protein ExbB